MPTASIPPPGGPTRTRAILANVIALALTLGTVLLTGMNPRVLLFAFILTYMGQLILLDLLLRIHRRHPSEGTLRILRWVTRAPLPGQIPAPLVEEKSGKAQRLGGYLLVWGCLTLFAFILAHVNADRELDFAWPGFAGELAWACLLTAVYLGQDLLARSLVVDFKSSAETNFGYNSSEVGMLGCAVLLAAAFVVVRQSMGAGSSAWVVMGPLVAMRHVGDLFTDIRAVKAWEIHGKMEE
jgi:hypothetical protein